MKIWDSVILMTTIDVFAITLFFVSLIFLYRFKEAARYLNLISGLSLILAGVTITALFYGGDLIAMHVFPLVMSMNNAMQAMKSLHLNYTWIFNLFSISLILFGFIHILKAIIPKLMNTLTELAEARRKAETETKSILLAVTEVSRVMSAVAVGDCSKRINVELTGELSQLKDSINYTAATLGEVVKQIKRISVGDYTVRIKPHSEQDVLSLALNDMITSLNAVISKADAITKGNLSIEITPRSDQDTLGISLNRMTTALRNAITINEKQNWLKTGQTQLNDHMQGVQNLELLSKRILFFLANYINAYVGVFFINERDCLSQSAAYALKTHTNNNNIKLGEGLVGQAAKEKKLIVFDHVPENHFKVTISSGLGESRPSSIIIIPLLYEGNIQGVIEFGVSKNFRNRHIEFLESIANSIAINIHSVKTNERKRLDN